MINLFFWEVDEVVSLVDQEYLQSRAGHVEPAGVYLTQLLQRNLKVCVVPYICRERESERGREREGNSRLSQNMEDKKQQKHLNIIP